MGPGGGRCGGNGGRASGTPAAASGAERLRDSAASYLVDVGVTVEMGKAGLRFERAGSSALSTLGTWGGGSRETSEQLLVGRGVWPHIHPSSPSPSTVINKYKRRRFQKTKNLLTGETEADPEMIKVREQSPWVPGAPGCSWPSSQAGSQLAAPPSCCGGSVKSPRLSDPQFPSGNGARKLSCLSGWEDSG